MKYFILSTLHIILAFSCVAHSEIAKIGEPLKKEYKLQGAGYDLFYQTGEFVDSYSMSCNMGQAVPDPNKDNWYVNKPIYGLKLELRARAAIKNYNDEIKPNGFVVVVKNKDVLITFKPIGDYVGNKWEGDVLNSWSGTSTDIEVFSERFGATGYAHFDLLDGNGFFYKTSSRDKPDYFLSNCKRIKKNNLPLYDWKLSSDESKQ